MRVKLPPLSFSTSSSLFFPNLKRTDGKLLLLEISKSQNCSPVGCLKCVQFDSAIGFGSIKFYNILGEATHNVSTVTDKVYE